MEAASRPSRMAEFPINRCHQRVVTPARHDFGVPKAQSLFPINRCHQRVVTWFIDGLTENQWNEGFQSIGVTSEW